MAKREVELVDASPLSPSVVGLRFRCLDGAPLAFTAGQWVNLHVSAAGAEHRRAYSIAGLSPPDRPDLFDLAVTHVEGGVVSSTLHAASPGYRCLMDGPHGLFTRTGLLEQPALFIGTGSGLAPLRAMLHEALGLPTRPRLEVLFGCRTQADILWRDELEAMAADGAASVYVTLSRPDADWQGMRGYVQEHVAAVVGTGPRPHVFICGLSPMVKGVRATLKRDLGYDRKRIHSERFD
ncbi:MAG: FAD-binding oxidoreductase [Myxococcales bacterium]|nr:FAD-binding oxidoreductase [Myxococcales bacterium]MDD9971772.1 FAD-binding oxidoreductase [Myxococcales bacterium]